MDDYDNLWDDWDACVYPTLGNSEGGKMSEIDDIKRQLCASKDSEAAQAAKIEELEKLVRSARACVEGCRDFNATVPNVHADWLNRAKAALEIVTEGNEDERSEAELK